MQWSKPDYQEICLGMEVTGYVNTDDDGNIVYHANRPSLPTQPDREPAPRQADNRA